MTTSSYPDNPETAGLGTATGPSSTSASTTSTSSTSTSSTSGSSTKEQAQQTASTAADEGKHVAGVAQDQASRVASEARSQARDLLQQTGTQVEEQSKVQRDRLVDTLRSFGEDLEKMASSSDNGLAGELARSVADRARSLSSHLDGREPRDLLDDVRGFARRKPGTFLLGALAAGVVAGRLTRGARDAKSNDSGTYGTTTTSTRAADVTSPADPLTAGAAAPSSGPVTSPQSQGLGTSTGDPLAGVDAPVADPAYPEGTDPAAGPGGVRP
jgi:hypothetical protein